MYSKLALFAAASMAAFVAAVPTYSAGGIENSCNTGSIQCCNSLQSSSSSVADSLKGIFGVATGPITGDVGVNCSPLTLIGLSGNSCSAQPVCCSNNSFNGLIAVGCTPLNLNI
ncbi:hydrophobin-251 [Phlegmacium glaucopus]|nr:hydrophobin-251 [Phlegmacium glaucopus]